MALEGLLFTTWVGCCFGILLIDRPWGPPSFTSWFSFSTLLTLLGFFMYCFITLDFFINNAEGMFFNDSHAFAKYVRALAIVSGIASTTMNRLAFILNAKKLGRVMQLLSQYGGGGGNGKKRSSCGTGWNLSWESTLVNGTFICATAGALIRGAFFTINNSSRPSWFNALGSWGFSIIYFLFIIFPLAFVTNCAFAIIAVLSIRVTQLFCDFCEEVKELLPKFVYDASRNNGYGYDDGVPQHHQHYHHRLEIYNILEVPPKFSVCRQRVSPMMTTNTSAASIISKVAELSKMDIVEQFEEIKELVKLTNESLSSLLLWLIIGIVFALIGTASHMFVVGVKGVDSITDTTLLVLLLVYCTVLQVGHKCVALQKKAKLGIHREFLNMPWTPGKLEMEDIVTEILNFEWKLSACGYFTLDRGLASGMFSVVLNYVIIFIQLNIALTDPAPTVCSKTNSTVQ